MKESSTELSRREVLSLLGAGVAHSALAGCSIPAPATTAAPTQLADPLTYSSTEALADAIRTKRVSSEEVVKAHLERIEAVNPKLNAVVQMAAERALDEAREADAALAKGELKGPLHGVPMTIKDSFDTAGVISTGGTTGRAEFVPKKDATVVARLREAGAILLGKTNTPELTLSFETNNLIYGRTSNPYDVNRTSGGSSGGAAAIIAAGGAPFDIGSDFGGSIRLPANWNGIAGIKPSAGRVPRTGHIIPFGGMLDSLQQIGPLARYVDDLGLTLPIIAGPDWIDPGVVEMPFGDPKDVDLRKLRVSFHTDNGIATPTPEVIEVVRSAAKALSDGQTRVDEIRPPGLEQGYDFLALYFVELRVAVPRLLKMYGTIEHTLEDFLVSPAPSPAELDVLITCWYDFRSRLTTFLGDYDVIVCPVNSDVAVTHGSMTTDEFFLGFSYTFIYNLTGWPGTVVRGGTSPEGMPIGVQILGRPGREDVTLAVAKYLETALGGFQPPSI